MCMCVCVEHNLYRHTHFSAFFVWKNAEVFYNVFYIHTQNVWRIVFWNIASSSGKECNARPPDMQIIVLLWRIF